ncbi:MULTISPECIES: acetyltransferase [Cupriavidus]|uniref:Acetyltransferase n=1 Tax=Cupriavidus pauculus TaxID=82633 RepID=A0A3G8GZL2_9BURK|nr:MULTISPECIES: acetyltransferase [Cupriavidus]AZG13628.1 acetyltransferase [Cupriavidus pauculus]MDT6960346.1 acetyltransferase [Cupriavidus sp. SZY C1]
MKRFAIFGASGFGREVMPVLREQLERTESEPWDLVFVDDNPGAESLNGHRVLTYAQWLAEPASYRGISLAIANSAVREKLAARCVQDGVAFVEPRAANVVTMDDVTVGEGAILCAFVMLTSNVRIGRQFHANIYSYVAHDCVVGDYVTLAPGVKCNGNVVIEDHAYIGTGAILKQGKPGEPLVIGRGAVVGMGAVVTKNVPPGVTVVGNPAKPLERRTN